MSLPFQVEQEEKHKFKPPHLRFEEGTVKDNAASLAAGRAVFKPVIRVFIRAPGDEKCEVPFIVEQDGFDEAGNPCKVFPWEIHLREKLHHGFKTREEYDYCMRSLNHWKATQQTLIEGTPVIEWQLLTKAEAENLRSLGILSVEQCADMNEVAMASYGMGGRAIKDKAKNWLSANTNPGKAAERISSLESNLQAAVEKADQASQTISAYEAKLAQLEAMINAQSTTSVVSEEVISLEPNYENMETDTLITLARKNGHKLANPNWKRETLIAKAKGG